MDCWQAVRDDVHTWKDAMYTQQHEWVEHGKRLKEKVTTMERQRAERDALMTLKKKLSLQVKKQVEQLAKEGKAQKELLLDSNRSQASRIRSETADEVRYTFFAPRTQPCARIRIRPHAHARFRRLQTAQNSSCSSRGRQRLCKLLRK